MADLSYLLGSAPATQATSQTQATGLPDWYLQASQGIVSQGAGLAAQGYNPYTGAQQAGFSADQQQAMQDTRNNQGAWQPYTDNATSVLNGVTPQVNQQLGAANNYGAAATSAVGGPAQTWNASTAANYMNPYTDSVVNEIARKGNENLTNNILPGVGDTFIGGGQFGSTRNADIIGRAVQATQSDITGQQSAALQAGYTGAQSAFNNDANRVQNQGQLQANTNLSAGNLANTTAQTGATAGLQTAGALSSLGSSVAGLGAADAANLSAIGGQQQQQQQQGLDIAHNDWLAQNNYDWTSLNNVNSLLNGQQLPVTQATSNTTTGTGASASPLAQSAGLYGAYRGITG